MKLFIFISDCMDTRLEKFLWFRCFKTKWPLWKLVERAFAKNVYVQVAEIYILWQKGIILGRVFGAKVSLVAWKIHLLLKDFDLI